MIRHSFRPWAFALTRDETEVDITACIDALAQTAQFLWGKPLNLYAAGGDKGQVLQAPHPHTL